MFKETVYKLLLQESAVELWEDVSVQAYLKTSVDVAKKLKGDGGLSE